MTSNYICRACTRALRQKRHFRGAACLRRGYAQSYGERVVIPTARNQPAPPSPTTQAIKEANEELEKKSHTREWDVPPPESQSGLPLQVRLAQQLRSRMTTTTETYVAYGATETLYSRCSQVADYTVPQALQDGAEIPKTKYGEDVGVGNGSWWYSNLGLLPTFNTWAQITLLHMYLLQARFRMFPPEFVGAWNQHLTDHFFHDAEKRMDALHRITARSIRNSYLKDLFIQYRGITAAYDEGLVRGDAVLAAAVWRNIFKAAGNEPTNKREMRRGVEEVDWVGIAQIVSWMRSEVGRLDAATDQQVTDGRFEWTSPEAERPGVLMEHRMMQEPFGENAGR